MKAYFNWRKKDQLGFEFRLPQFRQVLHSYDKMDEELQMFTFHRLKTCDDCGYCIQTDKSGKRPCLALDLVCENERQKKCPLYPNLSWNYRSKSDLTNMRRLFELAESLL